MIISEKLNSVYYAQSYGKSNYRLIFTSICLIAPPSQFIYTSQNHDRVYAPGLQIDARTQLESVVDSDFSRYLFDRDIA